MIPEPQAPIEAELTARRLAAEAYPPLVLSDGRAFKVDVVRTVESGWLTYETRPVSSAETIAHWEPWNEAALRADPGPGPKPEGRPRARLAVAALLVFFLLTLGAFFIDAWR